MKQLTTTEIERIKAETQKINSIKTAHSITYKGIVVRIEGKHEYRFDRNSRMRFTYYTNGMGRSYGSKNKYSLKQILDELIVDSKKEIVRKEKSDAFRALYQSLSTHEKIAHSNFAYARFQSSGLGNYYNIYWKSDLSPTGVELVGGCDEQEWESISKATGNSHNYYSPTENRMSAR